MESNRAWIIETGKSFYAVSNLCYTSSTILARMRWWSACLKHALLLLNKLDYICDNVFIMFCFCFRLKSIARKGNLHYRIQVGSTIWKKYVYQTTNVILEISSVNNIKSEESYTRNFRSESGMVQQCDSPTKQSSICRQFAFLIQINFTPGDSLCSDTTIPKPDSSD